MDILISELLWETLLISLTFSVFLMAIMQKLKALPWFKSDTSIWLANLFAAFLIGVPFAMTFYYMAWNESTLILALWVSFLGFIGAPGIYEALKAQKIINYTPKSRKELQPTKEEVAKYTEDLAESMGILGDER